MATGQWVEPNLHDWTGRMLALLREQFPFLAQQTREVRAEDIENTITKISDLFPGDGEIAGVLAKLRSRASTADAELDGMTVGGMLCSVFALGVDKAPLRQCLADMAQTCVQGDTHRLFALYVATSRDMAAAVWREEQLQ